jgi:hypothetical protein
MSVPLLVFLVVLAVGVGAVVGGMANRQLEESRDRRTNRSAAQRVRDAATRSVIRLWKWNRDRGRDD